MTHNAGRAAALTPRVRADPEVQHKAALYVASQARDAQDCRDLLDALGLLGRPLRSSERVRDERLRAQRRRSA